MLAIYIKIYNTKMWKKRLIVLFCLCAAMKSIFAVDIDYWKQNDPQNTQLIEHRLWAEVLMLYLVKDESGVNKFNYKKLKNTEIDRKKINKYVEYLSNITITKYNSDEQKYFWINLYNSLTVKVIVDHYPVETIRDIGSSLFSRGPWDKKLIFVEKRELSLNDIEHEILRPIWKDNRIHYAVNCASIGCPNLQAVPFTSKNGEVLLENGAREYVNHQRGVSFQDEDIILSSIYKWYSEDFGDNEKDLLRHFISYAREDLKKKLLVFQGDIDYQYNWDLNE